MEILESMIFVSDEKRKVICKAITEEINDVICSDCPGLDVENIHFGIEHLNPELGITKEEVKLVFVDFKILLEILK
jgi:hypothetical protein